jgi:hypothetical protein
LQNESKTLEIAIFGLMKWLEHKTQRRYFLHEMHGAACTRAVVAGDVASQANA